MSAIIFVLCIVVIILIAVLLVVTTTAMDLEERLKNANAEYSALDKKYKAIRRYCIKDNKYAPHGKYFIVGWLNMMQNIHSEKWYYISNEDQRKMGCDIDGDIMNIINADYHECAPKVELASKETFTTN